jgi:chromosome segregation ATPase
MSQSQSALSVSSSAREDAAPPDPTLVAKLQDAAKLANENCDRATALAHKLSAQLREAQSRINHLELEAERARPDRLKADAEAAITKLQSEANARVERTRREADARIAREEAETENRVRHLQGQLAQAKQLTDRANADARIAHDRIVRVEAEADDRLSRALAESEDRLIGLRAELAQAELRANRAEQWLGLIRREIEDRLMPPLAAMHDQPTFAGGELNRRPPVSEARDDARAATTSPAASDVASENESARDDP